MNRRDDCHDAVDLLVTLGQIAGVLAVIAAVQPDVLLLNEIDRDPGGEAVAALIARLAAAGVD
ncbi:MAG: hypothetical protein AAFQ88_16650, partial [Pseudomonadota bacterium]